MTTATFTLTLALEDDWGTQYDPSAVLHSIEHAVRTLHPTDPEACRLFTIARGEGIDTDTVDATREPVIVVQGFVPERYAPSLERRFLNIARAMNQRGIGWFVAPTGDTYVTTNLPL